MCTDKCPPGYSQQNYGTEPNFQCVCNNAKGFVEDGYFDGTFSGLKIPKCTCSKSYCTVMVYALGIGYTDGLIPNGSPPNCKVKADEVPAPILTEFVFYLVISTMLIFTFINIFGSIVWLALRSSFLCKQLIHLQQDSRDRWHSVLLSTILPSGTFF